MLQMSRQPETWLAVLHATGPHTHVSPHCYKCMSATRRAVKHPAIVACKSGRHAAAAQPARNLLDSAVRCQNMYTCVPCCCKTMEAARSVLGAGSQCCSRKPILNQFPGLLQATVGVLQLGAASAAHQSCVHTRMEQQQHWTCCVFQPAGRKKDLWHPVTMVTDWGSPSANCRGSLSDHPGCRDTSWQKCLRVSFKDLLGP